MNPFEKARMIAKIIDDKKGRKTASLEVSEISGIADYFIITSGGSPVQVKAIADEITNKMREAGQVPVHIEGYNSAVWILLDFSDVVVHIFTEETRAFYDLERLWADAKRVELTGDNIQEA